MSTNSISSPTTDFTAIANQLFKQIDRNHDGQLSSSEFGSFLTSLVTTLSKGTQAPTSPVGMGAQADDPAPTPQPFSPVDTRWVMAGFSPQNHIGETPTIITPKYAVYNELATLANDPAFDQHNFAEQAAADLQKLFGNPMWTDGKPLFRALDTETLVYGDEYVHTAPVGHGLHRGEYDPTAPGEFIWGVLQS